MSGEAANNAPEPDVSGEAANNAPEPDVSGEAANTAADPNEAPQAPMLRVVKGDPTPEELAALVAVVAAAASGGEPPAPRRPSEWSRPARRLRTPHHAGPGAWRASGLPR